MADGIVQISVGSLQLSIKNPRFDVQEDQRQALKKMATAQKQKLVKLANDILTFGLNPSENVLVRRKSKGVFEVLDGNRRLAAIKLMSSPGLLRSLGLPANLETSYRKLYDRGGASAVAKIRCSVLSEEESRRWILMRHTSVNDGVGTDPWDIIAKRRYEGNSPALQAVELVRNSPFIDKDIKTKLDDNDIALTTLERVLKTPGARKHLGLTINGSVLDLHEPKNESLAMLAAVIADITAGSKSSRELNSVEQRVAYAEEVSKRPKPSASAPIHLASATTSIATKPVATSTTAPNRRINPKRKSLIPTGLWPFSSCITRYFLNGVEDCNRN